MSNGNKPTLSRRKFVAVAAGAVVSGKAVLISARPVSAQVQQQNKQAVSQYQNTPNGAESSSTCTHYDAANMECMMLRGDFGPDGWCMYYTT